MTDFVLLTLNVMAVCFLCRCSGYRARSASLLGLGAVFVPLIGLFFVYLNVTSAAVVSVATTVAMLLPTMVTTSLAWTLWKEKRRMMEAP